MLILHYYLLCSLKSASKVTINDRNNTLQTEQLKAFVIEKLEDMKGRDIIALNISDKASFADYMVICSGNSNRHVKSLANSVGIECRAQGLEPLGMEGNDIGEWSLVDLGDIIVHVMTDEQRDKYNLEQLWAE
ncbi:MAG: ribosome-associated protein [Colwellia sp.]